MSPSVSKLVVLLAMFGWPLHGAEVSARPQPNAPKVAPASREAELAIKQFRARPGFAVELFAAEPLLAHPVAFAVDPENRVYVSESFRVGEQVTDIRKHMNWLDEELASTNTAQFRQLIEKYLDRDFMSSETERISRLVDTDGDGRADEATVFAEGFNDLTSGIASGVLVHDGQVYFTCIPDLWRLRDTNGDGRADEGEVLQHGYGVRFGFYGHDLHGLRVGPDGKLYFSIGDRGLNVLRRDGRRIACPESGAVLRCNLDGSGLELFATGLRNPQELAFNEYGDLFTGDNNSDGGDEARFVYLVEGGDSGWRIGWQFLNEPVSRGPWNAEKMWHPHNHDQPAFIVPPLANLANGPSGLTFNPGTGLPPDLDRHFFLADFKGNTALSLVHSFALQSKGASFEVVDLEPFLSNLLVTDVEFGTDGSVYVSDWVEGWGKTGKGRIYRVYHGQFRRQGLARQTERYLADGFRWRSAVELIELLSFPDQRVRQSSQFELAERGLGSIVLLSQLASDPEANPLARLHAVWALGQIYARSGGALEESLRPLLPLLQDPDGEVRAQSAKVLGDAKFAPARRALARSVTEERWPRTQFFAAIALGKIGGRGAAGSILEMIRTNADRDPYLRHAGVMGLYWIGDEGALVKGAQDSSSAVRLATLLTMRRQETEAIAQFLDDPDPRLVLEAARAINDLPIEAALPALARRAIQPTESMPLLRRIINANYRLGTAAAAADLALLAANRATPEPARLEALGALETWENPPGRDAVTGLWRPLPGRSGEKLAEAVRPFAEALMVDASPAVQEAALRLAGRYRLGESTTTVTELARSDEADPRVRVAALRALAVWDDPSLAGLLEGAAASNDAAVRQEATALLASLNPAAAVDRLSERLQHGSVGEKQAALLALGKIDKAEVEALLVAQMDELLAGRVEPELHLDLLEAVARRESPALEKQLKAFDEARPATETGKYIECLAGGNPALGRKIFFEKVEASCVRCHQIGGVGGQAGPALDREGMDRSRKHLLESIVAPNKLITPGFETITIFLKNDDVYSGTVKLETEDVLVLVMLEEGTSTLKDVAVQKTDIDVRRTGLSGMPEGLPELISKRDLRDLVEFLAQLDN